MGYLMLPHPLKNFETQKYYQNEPRFDTHWNALFCNKNEIVYFDSFGVEYIPDEIKDFIRNKNIIAKIFRVQANNSIFLVKDRLILRIYFLHMTLKKMTI